MGELKAIEGFLQFARSFYQRIQYFGPLRFQVTIENRPHADLFLNRPNNVFRGREPRLITHDGNLVLDLTKSSAELFDNPSLILKEIADRMFRAFGIWEADCFDKQLNLKRE